MSSKMSGIVEKYLYAIYDIWSVFSDIIHNFYISDSINRIYPNIYHMYLVKVHEKPYTLCKISSIA